MNINRFSSGKSSRLAAIAAAFTLTPLLVVIGVANAATLTTTSLSLSDPRPYAVGPPIAGDAVKYDYLASGITNASTVRCVQMKFSANADGTGTVTGFDSTLGGVAVNTGQSNFFASHAGWTLDKSVNGTLKYTNSTGSTPAGASTQHFVVDGIRNGTVASDDYYVTFATFGNIDCTTSPVDSSVVGFIYTVGQQVSLTVDGTLTFAVAGVTGNGVLTANSQLITNTLATTASTIPFGTLTSSTNRVAAQDLTVSTNSGTGYTVSTRYTAKPTAGTFTIDDLATHTNAAPGSFSAAGTEAFGYTTEDGTLGTGTPGRFTATGGNKWAPFTTTNGEIAYNAAAVANQTTRVGFQAGIAATTEPGAYQTTVIYTATPVY